MSQPDQDRRGFISKEEVLLVRKRDRMDTGQATRSVQ